MIGFSKQTREVKVFHFDGKTGELLGSESVVVPPDTGLPADCTIMPPPADKKGQAQVWNKGTWVYLPDHRGLVVYDKANGQSSEITEIGDIPEGFTTVAPDVEYPEWKDGAWSVNDAWRDADLVELARSRKTSELSRAYDMIRPLDYAEKIGALTETEATNHKAIMTFIVEMSRVNTDKPEEISWPELTIIS